MPETCAAEASAGLISKAAASYGYVVIACVRTGKSVKTLLHACGPGGLIAMTTTSSAAVYWTCAKHMEDDLDLERNAVDFSLPLGIPLYQPEIA